MLLVLAHLHPDLTLPQDALTQLVIYKRHLSTGNLIF